MIPTQRSGQVLRLLVLGTGDEARAVRDRASAVGAELAQRFSSRVTHVVVDGTVGAQDARLARARDAGLPVLDAADGAALLDELASYADEEEGAAQDDATAGYHSPEAAARGGVQAGAVESGDAADGSDAPVPGGTDSPAPMDDDGAAVPVQREDGEGDRGTHGAVAEHSVTDSEAADGGSGAHIGAADDGAHDLLSAFTASALESDPVFTPVAETSGEPVAAVSPADADGHAGAESILLDEAAALAGPPAAEGSQATQMPDAAAPAAARESSHSTAASVVWALVPLVSIGLLTPVSIGYAALRLRSRALVVATAWYALAVCAALALSAAAPRGSELRTLVGYLLIASCGLGGAVHSFLIRRRVFR